MKIVLGVVVLSLLVGPVTGVDDARERQQATGIYQQEFDADSVLMAITVAENGSAEWRIRYRIALETKNETEAFESLQSDIQANTSAYLSDFRTRITETVANAENATGRQMNVSGFDISTSQQPVSESGFVTYSFQWSNFAVVSGSQLQFGDAISGLFLDAQTTLTVSWPAEYSVESVEPQFEQRGENSGTWNGRLSFDADQPRIIVTTASGSLAAYAPVVIAGLVIVGGLVVAWVYRDRVATILGSEPGDRPVTTPNTAPSSEGDAGTPPSELLSNEEQVTQLLEANGGRMKQQDVVSELEWTEAKTSQVVNGMKEDGDLEVFRIGRENVLKLPDEPPADDANAE